MEINMITTTRTYTRSTLFTPWHIVPNHEPDIYTTEFKDHVRATYTDNIISQTNTMSPDELTLTFQSTWTTLEAYQTYVNDPICQATWARRDQHNEIYGIITSPVVITEI